MPAHSITHPHALSARDLINVGVFAAVYFVIMFGFGMLGLLSPVMSAAGYLLGILANGVVIALYLARVPKIGALTLLMVMVGLLMTLTGHPIYTLILSPLLGLAADVIARSGGHRSRWRNCVAYGVLSLWYVGPMLPIVWDTVGYREYVASSMGAKYAEAYVSLFSPTNLVIFGFLLFAVALLGGWFGQRLLERHFRRAGVA